MVLLLGWISSQGLVIFCCTNSNKDVIIFTKILSDNAADKKAQIGLDKLVSLTCTAVLCLILLSVVPFIVRFSLYFMIHSHCDGLYI